MNLLEGALSKMMDGTPEFRCLDEMTVMTARMALADRDAVRIPYICQVSGRAKELLVISRDAAERMVVATKGTVTIDEARLLALVHISQLCEADIPDLVRMPRQKSVSILEGLANRGLAIMQKAEDVCFYRQNLDEVHMLFSDLALGATSA